jgi:molybdopterin converting factor small subunit
LKTETPMKIQLLFFASLRETLGGPRTLELPAGATVAQVRALLAAEGEAAAEAGAGPASAGRRQPGAGLGRGGAGRWR